MTRILPVLVSLLLTTACVVAPPVRMSAGAGGAVGDIALRNSASEVRTHSSAAEGQLRVAFTPQTLGQHPERRPIDLSFGWTLDWTSVGNQRHDFRHGPFVEGVWFRRQESMIERKSWRYGPTVLVELPIADERENESPFGIGGAIGGIVEMVDAAHGPFFLGGWRGELGIGFSARVGVRHIDGGRHAYGVVSVELRLPGVAALAVIPPTRPR